MGKRDDNFWVFTSVPDEDSLLNFDYNVLSHLILAVERS